MWSSGFDFIATLFAGLNLILMKWQNPDEETVPGIEHPGSTGVIYCSDRAMANGFSYASSHEWANLGQGAPEVGDLPGAPPRPTHIDIPFDSLEYAPTTGVKSTFLFPTPPRQSHKYGASDEQIWYWFNLFFS